MLLRKHLSNARIESVTQYGFERVIEIAFNAHDELGFECKKYVIIEIMGKHSNIIFCDQNKKILNAIKIIDFSTSQKRQVLPGMIYEMPPVQDKINPLEETEFKNTAKYLGFSQLIEREIDGSQNNFTNVVNIIKTKNFTPVLVSDLTGKPIEYAFMPITQYGNSANVTVMDSFSELIDTFFMTRDRTDRINQKSADITKTLNNIENRLIKKIINLKTDLKSCAEKDKFKLYGDLIISNIYKLKKGMDKAELLNYYDDSNIEISLDLRLTPSQNAQRYFKKYNKAKTAEVELTKQIAIAEDDLKYIETVIDSLSRAENENDINEIRNELYESGYIKKMNQPIQKNQKIKPLEFVTDGGFKVYCGKNNIQNDFITLRVAEKTDYWFHVKNQPGSHVIMQVADTEPSELDFTQAASVAAFYSKAADGVNVPVDYTLVKNIKKPNGSKPGFVTYLTYWTAYVTPDKTLLEKLSNNNLL